MNQFTSDCLMHKYKSVGDPLLYKEVVVGQSKLSDQRKAAAKASFDLCMAQNLTLPYRMFPHDLETIPGRPIFKAIAALCNAIFSIGHQSPTLQMRAVDCASAALTLNVSSLNFLLFINLLYIIIRESFFFDLTIGKRVKIGRNFRLLVKKT